LIPRRNKILLLPSLSRPVLWATQLHIQWVSGALSPEVKPSGREADHSAPTSAEVKNTWVYTSTKMDLREIGWDGMDWIDMAQDRDQ
jgi:hypothetical protein